MEAARAEAPLDVEHGYWQLILTGAGTVDACRRVGAPSSAVPGCFWHGHTAIARQSGLVGEFVRGDGSVAR